MSERKYYFGKVMLFGEYSIIHGSPALLIPMTRVVAHWVTDDELSSEYAQMSHHNLRLYADYLKNSPELAALIDTDSLAKQLDEGLYFRSTIPNGYGLGSSGALVAAVFERFHKHEINNLIELKSVFAKMENQFHENSSGIDPLQCYIAKPFHIDANKTISELPDNFLPSEIHIFLVDSQTQSATKPLVQYFENQRNNAEYLQEFEKEYLPCVSDCINQLIAKQPETFFKALTQLNALQMKLFRPMIPDNMLNIFQHQSTEYHFGMKILGSGGGGYLLGFCDEKNKVEKYFNHENQKPLWLS